MEMNNNNNGTHDEELYSLSEMISSLSSEHRNELNPLQEIFGAHSTLPFSKPKDATKNSDQRGKKDHCNKNNHATKRQRSMEYRVLMEKKRRQVIRDKVDILQELTPNCAKSDLATKLESIVQYIKSLKYQIDMMSKAYTEPAGYMAPFYGAQAPCMSPYTSPWCYYGSGIPMMPHQNIPFNPQFHQVYETAPPNQTQSS